MRRFFALTAVCALSVSALAACSGSSATSSSGSLVRPLGAGETATVSYCNGQKASITEPPVRHGPAPVAVYIHGGAWVSGDHQSGGFVINEIGPALVADGFIVVTVNYRLGPKYQWPDQIEDAMCAIRFLRANAGLLHLDPNEIGVWGHSAGGHLSALIGTGGPAAWDVGPYTDESSSVQAVVDMAGPSNLLTLGKEGTRTLLRGNFMSLLADVPSDQLQDELRAASPVTYVAPGDPPFLLMHSDNDEIVYPAQTTEMAAALSANHVPHEVIVVHGGGHNFNQPGGTPDPAAITAIVVDFFLRVLVLHEPIGSG